MKGNIVCPLPDSAPEPEPERSWRGEKAGEGLLQHFLPQAAQPCRDASCVHRLCKERCSAAWGEPCSGSQTTMGSTACLEIWPGLGFHQDTGILGGIPYLAQRMGQASCPADMGNNIIAACLPLCLLLASPAHLETVAGGEVASQFRPKSSSWASVVPRTVPPLLPLAPTAPSPDGACEKESKLAWDFPLPAADSACASMGKGSQAIASGKEGQEHLLSLSMGHPTAPALLPALLERLEPSPVVASHPAHLSLSISSARRP